MDVIIHTPFKVGSTSLSAILCDNFNFKQIWQKSYNIFFKRRRDKERKKNIILRGHEKLNVELKPKFKVWFTLIRKPTDIYVSGYFQDIDTESYSYYLGKDKVEEISTEKLLEHFLSFKWNNFEQFSFDFNFKQILKYTGIDIYKEEFNKEKGFSIYKSPIKDIKVCVITLETLNQNIKEILFELGISKDKNKKINIQKKNNGEEKWYKEKYIELKKILPMSYYKKYEDEDRKILEKFFL